MCYRLDAVSMKMPVHFFAQLRHCCKNSYGKAKNSEQSLDILNKV